MKTLCWCSRTMRWCTASARCWRKCRGTIGSNSPTCGRSTLFFTRIRERKCSSWARNWGSGLSGIAAQSLDWNLLEYEPHRKLQGLVAQLNQLYRAERALHQIDFEYPGFEWIDFHDADHSVIAFLRKGQTPGDHLVVVCNFTPVPHQGYRVGVPEACFYREILNTDDAQFGGSGVTNAHGPPSHPAGVAKPALPRGTDPAAPRSDLFETGKVERPPGRLKAVPNDVICSGALCAPTGGQRPSLSKLAFSHPLIWTGRGARGNLSASPSGNEWEWVRAQTVAGLRQSPLRLRKTPHTPTALRSPLSPRERVEDLNFMMIQCPLPEGEGGRKAGGPAFCTSWG